MEYKKLDIPFWERLTFLFTSLISKKYLEDKTEYISTPHIKQEENPNINNKEEKIKMDIPFFELDSTETKSNL